MNEEDLDRLATETAELIVNSERIVIFSGAGISTESGIPDFRSPGGIWKRFDPEDFTYQKFVSNATARRKQWRLFHELSLNAEPNPAHLAIARLFRLRKLDCVITQNVDNLHQRGGVPDKRVLEMHGNYRKFICLSCLRRFPTQGIMDRLEKGEDVPDCNICHGVLKPDIVLFGEELPEEAFRKALKRAGCCDLCIVVGSSLLIYPAASIPEYALDTGAKLVIINLSPTPLDDRADFVVNAKAGEFMPEVVRRVKDGMD
ncbi:MAG: NAD-dependent deacylase [Dehalococcoidia bacterium]|nr:MAG: NAD-dependent deacylase [Dehalococcoidia bacterium]